MVGLGRGEVGLLWLARQALGDHRGCRGRDGQVWHCHNGREDLDRLVGQHRREGLVRLWMWDNGMQGLRVEGFRVRDDGMQGLRVEGLRVKGREMMCLWVEVWQMVGLGVEGGRKVDWRLGVGSEWQVVGWQDPGALVRLRLDVGLNLALVSDAQLCHNLANFVIVLRYLPPINRSD